MAAFQNFGQALVRLAAARNVNRAELARRLGISKSTITKWLGPRSSPNVATVERILEALGCSLYDLADALDAVNKRGRYSAASMTAATEIAEGVAAPFTPQQVEAIGSLYLQVSLQKDRIRDLETQLRTKD